MNDELDEQISMIEMLNLPRFFSEMWAQFNGSQNPIEAIRSLCEGMRKKKILNRLTWIVGGAAGLAIACFILIPSIRHSIIFLSIDSTLGALLVILFIIHSVFEPLDKEAAETVGRYASDLSEFILHFDFERAWSAFHASLPEAKMAVILCLINQAVGMFKCAFDMPEAFSSETEVFNRMFISAMRFSFVREGEQDDFIELAHQEFGANAA